MNDGSILIAWDGSDGASRAVDVAAALFPTARALVLSVEPPMSPAETYLVMASAASGREVEEANNAEALEHADAGAEYARRAGLDAEARSSLLDPVWEAILAAAEEIDAAVIVVGSRGRKGARELFEGSTSHQVAVHARRPVLIVPAAPRS